MHDSNYYIEQANNYISDVINKKINTCKFIRQACKRQVKDLKRKRFAFHFDESRATKPCKFIECLTHIKGPLAGQCIKLEPWQIFIITTAFGWVDKKGARRFKTVYIEVPRKNGKSALSSGIALYCLCADGEQGAEIYSFATKKDQARIVFDAALAMARKNKDLVSAYGITLLNNSMAVLGTNSVFKPMSSEDKTLDGLNPHLAVIDELHAHKTRGLFDVIVSAMGARAQSLLWIITTAGFFLDGICMEQRRIVEKILRGDFEDDTYFGVIYSIDDNDDWKELSSLEKANPNWGVSVIPENIIPHLKRAIAEPSSENNFKTKYLDVWCNANTAWMQMAKWRKCIRKDLKLEDFEGQPCIYGIDLASKTDIAAVIKIFWKKENDSKLHYYIFSDFYLPSETIRNSNNSQYDGWVKRGFLHATEGPVIDLTEIQDFLAQDFIKYETLAMAYDPWQATQLAQNLMLEGAPMVELRPTIANFSEAMKTLYSLVLENRIHTNGDPVLEWMVSNVVCHVDAKDNIYPRKETAANKIDGVVAAISAINQIIQLDVENNYAGEDEGPVLLGF